MSTLSISPAFARPTRPVRRPRPARTRLTRRGRAVAVLALLAAALVLTTALGGWAAATHGASRPVPVRVVTVEPGDTLYDLAGQVAAPGHVQAMVHRIQDLNALEGSTLEVGQQIAVPRR